ncbi:MarR family winged helix-turn-helix transcriptional regulator [Rhodococcus antarcticus]|jgi:DNA-binding MarR family transcriptional regulator|uniref:MarR family winged helix-turn-helix transcriptional regulator n=1 Tax=Rhodococcus antarcticus TaxID=2987751 RepID=UPI0025B712E4|nr:MarR family transcriptional regulator [Rhodococcus antarcticus]
MTTPAAVTLDERLCLALYTASRAMTSRYRPLLGELGLTYPQYLVMVLLWEEGDASVGQVGARLDLESSTLSPLLKRLEAMGLVTRTRASRDERSVTVGLTAAGRGLEARAAHVPAAICDATALTTPGQAALVAQLRTLAVELAASLEP